MDKSYNKEKVIISGVLKPNEKARLDIALKKERRTVSSFVGAAVMDRVERILSES